MNRNDLINLLGEKWIPNLVGLIGGSLGIYGFIDNYILRFKPKIHIASQVVFKQKDSKHCHKELDKAILTLEISNHRKKYGLIYDFAIKIYRTDEVNPEVVTYYSSELGSYMDSNSEEFGVKDIKPFSPISVLPNSSKSVVVMFGEVVNRSKSIINSSASHYIELYYQTKAKDNWKYVETVYLYNLSNHRQMIENKPRNLEWIFFTSLNYDKSREKIMRSKKNSSSGIYSGAYHKERDLVTHNLKYKMGRPFAFLVSAFRLVFIHSKLLSNRVIDQTIKKPILHKYIQQESKLNASINSPELQPFITSSISNLHEKLSSLADELNTKAKPDRIIKIDPLQQDSFNISCYHMMLRIHKTGGTDIYVQEVNAQFGSKLRLRLIWKKDIFVKGHWELENFGYCSIHSFAVKILDFLVLHYHR